MGTWCYNVPMNSLQKKVYYLRTDRDADLITWLQAQPSASATVRIALRLLLGQEQGGSTPGQANIEEIVTRAVERALAGLSLAGPVPAPDGGGEDEEAGAMIDDLLGQF